MRARQSQKQRTLLSIGQASKLLGVNETTLRQWTDEGKIKAFVTPGGHRRYVESDVLGFMGTQRKVHGIRDLIARMEQAPSIELELAHTRFASASWYHQLDQQSRARLGELGRRIHGLVILSITRPGKQSEALDLAREVGREFGEYLFDNGLSLTDSLEAFILHRSTLLNLANDLIKGRESVNERAAEAMPLVTQLTDAVLVSLVDAYQNRQADRGLDGGGANT